jgi:cytochrome P450
LTPIIQNTRKHVSSILRHEKESEYHKTIFHELRDSDLPTQEKTLERLSDEGNILIGAGSKTTAQILAILSYHLISNPDIMAKLRQELDTVMPDLNTPIKWQQLEQLPYLVSLLIFCGQGPLTVNS